VINKREARRRRAQERRALPVLEPPKNLDTSLEKSERSCYYQSMINGGVLPVDG
jgi:hypothetical protein